MYNGQQVPLMCKCMCVCVGGVCGGGGGSMWGGGIYLFDKTTVSWAIQDYIEEIDPFSQRVEYFF